MTESPDGPPKTLEEVLKHLMSLAEQGEVRPVFVQMQIRISQVGPPAPRSVRGDSTDPEIELHRIGPRVTLVTELPGMLPENVRVLFRGDRVFIWAHDQERQYRAERSVPPAQAGSVEITFHHGVLEVSYLPEDPACPQASRAG